MSSSALWPFFLLYLLFKGEKPKPKPPHVVYHPVPMPPGMPPLLPTVAPVPVVHTPIMLPAPPAWPAAIPAGLPPFPGPGWVPDSPPPAPVVARAVALLPQLWARGVGATATEQTAGRWITYLAAMVGTKKSVIAYRLAPTVATMPPAAPAPGVVPAVYHPAPAGAPSPAAVPVAAPAGPVHIPASPATGLPTLKLTHPEMKGPSVVYLQRKLRISDDGTFGSGTDRAVRAFQGTHFDPLNGQKLKQDGVVGPATWRALG